MLALPFMFVAASVEYWMGRRPWGVSGIPGLWSGDVWSSHNSQFLFDPYSLTHLTHGILLFVVLAFAFKLPMRLRFLIAVALESSWEVLENSSWIIDRYRAETVSLNYYGDSIVNSMGDILACMAGFYLASRLPSRVTIAAVIAIELLLLLWTHDNLTLNVIMLIHPSQAIRAWQLAH
jgi:hypothetical protein